MKLQAPQALTGKNNAGAKQQKTEDFKTAFANATSTASTFAKIV